MAGFTDMALPMVVLSWTLAALSCIVVAMRIYLRVSRNTLGSEDYLMLFGLVR